VVGVALLLTACSTPAPQPTSTLGSTEPTGSESAPTMSIPPTPQANPITSAVEATAARGTAALQVDALTEEQAIRGSGVVDFIQQSSDMTWADDLDPQWQVREIHVDDVTYFSSDGATWDEVPSGVVTPTAGIAEPLRGLTEATEVTLETVETFEGQQLRRYRVELPPDPSTFGFLAEQVAELGVQLQVEALVWVDSQGRITRVLRTLVTPTGPVATTDAQLTGFGEPVTIRAPAGGSTL